MCLDLINDKLIYWRSFALNRSDDESFEKLIVHFLSIIIYFLAIKRTIAEVFELKMVATKCLKCSFIMKKKYEKLFLVPLKSIEATFMNELLARNHRLNRGRVIWCVCVCNPLKYITSEYNSKICRQ